jgi:hypothetical protein
MKITKLLVSLILLATICSCSTSTNPKGYAFAEKLCKDNGGLYELEINLLTSNKVHCNNGATFYISHNGFVYNTHTNKPDTVIPNHQVCDELKDRDNRKYIDQDIQRLNEETKMLHDNQPQNLYPGDVK